MTDSLIITYSIQLCVQNKRHDSDSISDKVNKKVQMP